MILFLIKTWLNSGLFRTYGNTPDEIHAVKLQKNDKKKVSDALEGRAFQRARSVEFSSLCGSSHLSCPHEVLEIYTSVEIQQMGKCSFQNLLPSAEHSCGAEAGCSFQDSSTT